jgi:hypothetical protein
VDIGEPLRFFQRIDLLSSSTFWHAQEVRSFGARALAIFLREGAIMALLLGPHFASIQLYAAKWKKNR